MSLSIFHPLGIYNPYGSGRIGQSFSYGDITLKFTTSSHAIVTDGGSNTYEADFWKKWGKTIMSQMDPRYSDKYDFSSVRAPHDYGQPLMEAELIELGQDDTIKGRLSEWQKTNEFTGLVNRDGQVQMADSLIPHNGEIYERRVREEYAAEYAPGEFNGIRDLHLQNLGKIALPDTSGSELQIHVMTEEEAQAADAEAYDMSHYSMADSFLMDLESGGIEDVLSATAKNGDIFTSVESFSHEAARYDALLHHFYGDSESAGMLGDKLSGIIERSLQAFSGHVSDDISGFFTENGVNIDNTALAGTIQDITRARLGEYQDAYKRGEISVQHTNISVYGYMAGQGAEISADNAQFGEITYNELIHLSEAVYEFSNSLIMQPSTFLDDCGTTAEKTGMLLGLSKAQVRLMDDGSAVFAAFKGAADNKVGSAINNVVKESLAKSELFKNNGGGKYGMTYKPISRKDITTVMNWFSGIEHGDIQTNMQLAINKVFESYVYSNRADVKYESLYSKNDSRLNYMPDAFWKDMSANVHEMKSKSVTDAQSFQLISWNIWVSSSNAVHNGGKYTISAPGSAVDVTA